MGSILYRLREDFEGTVLQRAHDDDPGTEVDVYQGGVINIGDDGEGLDVKDALAEGNGEIAVDENNLRAVAALDEYPPLKRVGRSEDPAGPTGYAAKTADVLRGDAKGRDLAGYSDAKKPELVAALEAHDRVLAGELELEAPPDPLTIEALAAASEEA